MNDLEMCTVCSVHPLYLFSILIISKKFLSILEAKIFFQIKALSHIKIKFNEDTEDTKDFS